MKFKAFYFKTKRNPSTSIKIIIQRHTFIFTHSHIISTFEIRSPFLYNTGIYYNKCKKSNHHNYIRTVPGQNTEEKYAEYFFDLKMPKIGDELSDMHRIFTRWILSSSLSSSPIFYSFG